LSVRYFPVDRKFADKIKKLFNVFFQHMQSIAFSALVFSLTVNLFQLWPQQVWAENQPILSQSNSTNESNDSLSAARDQLEKAFTSFREEDFNATREHLSQSRALLDRSVLNSTSQTVKTEAKKLVDEIDAFQQKLADGEAGRENSIARFWRRATSFIRREAEQLVDQYIELSQNEKTFKHLLDAKMHLFIAEHDLFVSHDARDAYAELNQVLADLALAQQEAVEEVLPEVKELSGEVTFLQDAMNFSSKSWLDNEVLMHLQNASSELVKAEKTALPDTSLQIGVIRHQIDDLRKQVETINLRNDYDKIMEHIKMIISKLETE